AVVISCGGSAGPEGPIAALGAAIGSVVGRVMRLAPHERRILLLAGCAAGIGAIFQCPLGGALFAVGILYSEPEFESDAIVTAFVASVLGYSTYMVVLGFEGPMLEGIDAFRFSSPGDLIWYAVLGPMCGITSIFFYWCLRLVEKTLVPRSRMPRWLLPALGGLATGGIACVLPQVMDGRFIFIQASIDGALPLEGGAARWVILLLLVLVGKCLATAFTVGSGAPGGVLGPSVFIGGLVGALLGAVGHVVAPELCDEQLQAALIPVGMAGVLAAAMRIPLAAMVMVTEMTGSYGLIAPLMLVCVTSYVIGKRWGLNAEQVRSVADSPAHAVDPIVHLLESWRVRDLMQADWPFTVAPDSGLDELIGKIEPGTRPVVAVADGSSLQGLVSASDIGRIIEEERVAALLVASDIMTTRLVTIAPDEDVYTVLSTFCRVEHEVLPVVDAAGRWIGMLSRRQVVDRLHEQLRRARVAAFREHAGLTALERDVQLDQLLLGVSEQHAHVERLFVPLEALGLSLRESDLRRRFGIQVIAVEQRDGSITCPPDLDAPLRVEQRLLAINWRAVER
ncbi:MAG: chloride channel protein, partial [Planctomycetota bacterium]